MHPTLGAPEELEAALPPSVTDLRGTALIDGYTKARRLDMPVEAIVRVEG